MRIIAGSAKGRRLFSPGAKDKGRQIRPTTDRARESLFNIIGAEKLHGSKVLDLFAGTGALGLEAVSRGAEMAVFVDKAPLAINLIQKNISICGFSTCLVLKRDVQKGLFFLHKQVEKYWQKVCKVTCHDTSWPGYFDLIFLDPPYKKSLCADIVSNLVDNKLLGRESIVICEESSAVSLPEMMSSLNLFDQRKYGDTGFWFYK